MILVLTMIFTACLLNSHDKRLFLLFYGIVLLLASQFRLPIDGLGYDTTGKSFFRYYSDVQLVLAVISACLLTSWSRIISVSLFLLFSLYNLFIYYWWGVMPVVHYDDASFLLAMAIIFTCTYKEQTKLINLLLFGMVGLAAVGQARFL